jgi:hypothetical protein
VGGSKAKQGRVFAYIVPKIEGEHGIILGRPWRRSEDAIIDPETDTLHIRRTGVIVRNQELLNQQRLANIAQVTAVTFSSLAKRYGKRRL